MGKFTQKSWKRNKKDSNSIYNYKATSITVDDKIMGALLIESENNKNYEGLKRLIINSTTQGNNGYPTGKASTYKMLYKYIPERPNINNKLTEMRDRLITDVSFY